MGVYRRGGIWWFAWTDARGARRFESSRIKGRPGTGKDKRAAVRMLAEKQGDAAKGIPVIDGAARFTFDDAARLITENYIAKDRRSLADLQRRLDKHLTPYFGGALLRLISVDMIDRFVALRKKAGASNGEINRELAALKRMFTLAARAGKIHARPHIDMLAEAKPREGFFGHADFEAVLTRLDPDVAALARFAYITGWRWKSEIQPLTWGQVDRAHGAITIPAGRTKGGEPRTFVITPELDDVLTTREAARDAAERTTGKPCALVFHRNGKPLTWFYDQWRDACTAAGVDGRLLHDLRRTAIRNLIRAGVSESVAMKMSGHKTRSVFERYNVTAESDLRHAAQLLSVHHQALSAAAKKAQATVTETVTPSAATRPTRPKTAQRKGQGKSAVVKKRA